MVTLLGLIGAGGTVDYAAPLPDGGEGPRWADPVAVSGCRVERGTKRIRTAEGRVVTVTARVYSPAAPAIEVGGRIDVRDGRGWRVVHTLDVPVWLSGRPMHHEIGIE